MTAALSGILTEMDVVVERAREASDRVGYFAAMYRSVTREIDRRVRLGDFQDSGRMEEFAAAFARRYLDAVQARHAGGSVPAAWTAAFDAGARWRPTVLQHLMLGMNAHINLDLGVVTAEFADEVGLASIATDFHGVNAILATMIGSCQRLVGQASPWIGVLDRAGGRTDTTLVRFSLVRARKAAWHTAERLSRLPPEDRAEAIEQLDRTVRRLADTVLEGPTVVNAAALVVRLGERARVRAVIDLLSTASPAAV